MISKRVEKEPIIVRINSNINNELKLLATKMGISKNALIANIIFEYLKKNLK